MVPGGVCVCVCVHACVCVCARVCVYVRMRACERHATYSQLFPLQLDCRVPLQK